MAGVPGFEPGLSVLETDVLTVDTIPLHRETRRRVEGRVGAQGFEHGVSSSDDEPREIPYPLSAPSPRARTGKHDPRVPPVKGGP